MFSLKGILLSVLFLFSFPQKTELKVFTPHGEEAPECTHSGPNLLPFSACPSLNGRNSHRDQFTTLSEPQAGRKHPVPDLLLLGENEQEGRLPQPIVKKRKDLGHFSRFTDGCKFTHPSLPRTVPVYACYSRVIINSTPIYSQKYSRLDNKLQSHPFTWTHKQETLTSRDGQCLPCLCLLMLELGTIRK